MTSSIHGKSDPRGLAIMVLACGTLLFTARHEGYLPHISLMLWTALACGVAVGFWATSFFTPQRIAAFLLVSLTVEYVKEGLGIEVGAWRYSDVHGQFSLGVWAWALVTLACCTLAMRVAVRVVRLTRLSLPRWLHAVLVTAIACLIPITMGPYLAGTNTLYWLFYGGLLILSIVGAWKVSSVELVAIVVTAWCFSFPCEYSGSVGSGIWTFTYNPTHPPLFLLLGCWPIEILAQYTLSALVCGQPLSLENNPAQADAKA